MTLKRRLEKLEKAAGSLSCSVCHDWWKDPMIIRYEWEPPPHRDPDICPRCGQQRPNGLILEIIISKQTDPPRPFMQVV
jgi:hypothetical protein